MHVHLISNLLFVFFFGATTPSGPWPPHSRDFCITQRRTTVSRIPLDKWSSRRRDLYLTTYNKPNRETSMHPLGFEPTISAGERPQNYALDRAATGTGSNLFTSCKLWCYSVECFDDCEKRTGKSRTRSASWRNSRYLLCKLGQCRIGHGQDSNCVFGIRGRNLLSSFTIISNRKNRLHNKRY